MKINFKSALSPFFLCAALSVATYSCRTAEMAVNSNLKNDSEVYNVKGKQGTQIGQVISFGDYKTSKVKRGWTSAYSIPFIVTFQGAREKLSFTQFRGDGASAEVSVVSRFKETDYTPLKDYFSVSLKYKNYFAGAVRIDDSDEIWDFVVHHVDGASRSLNQNPTVGMARNGNRKIEIKGIRALEGATTLLTQNDVYGYEFLMNGQTLGTVSTINNGKIWFKNGLSPEMKLVMASISSGLLLRNHVEENALGMN